VEERIRILVVDDEEPIRDLFEEFLSDQGFSVVTAPDGETALRLMKEDSFDLLITDLEMPDIRGIDLLEKAKEMVDPPTTILITGYGTVETAVEAMKKGAYDYVLKPFKLNEILQIINRAVEKRKLEKENVRLRQTLSLYQMSEAMGTSLDLNRVIEMISDTILQEFNADLVVVVLQEETIKKAFEKWRVPSRFPPGSERIDFARIMETLLAEKVVLVHGEELTNYLIGQPPEDQMPETLMAVPLKVRDQVLGMMVVVSFARGRRFVEGERKALLILASRAAIAVENARLYRQLEEAFRETIEGLVFALEAKDRFTRGHSERVSQYAKIIAEGMGLPEEEVEKISQAARLHDIGKIGIKMEALLKEGKLTPEEYKMFQTHPEIGKRILEPIGFLQDIVPLIYHHHERYDGTGYPERKKGEEIPLGARILAVADSYDVMTSDRPYRKALSVEEAVEELRRNRGTQFDPHVVDVFIEELKKRGIYHHP